MLEVLVVAAAVGGLGIGTYARWDGQKLAFGVRASPTDVFSWRSWPEPEWGRPADMQRVLGQAFEMTLASNGEASQTWPLELPIERGETKRAVLDSTLIFEPDRIRMPTRCKFFDGRGALRGAGVAASELNRGPYVLQERDGELRFYTSDVNYGVLAPVAEPGRAL